jgi:predicted Zn-dependent protease
MPYTKSAQISPGGETVKHFAEIGLVCILTVILPQSLMALDRPETAPIEEGHLWEAAQQKQQQLDQSGLIYQDPILESYLNSVADKLAGQARVSGKPFRVRIIKSPFLNAFTYPNGICYIHTGLLARLDNEAQLAALLAHEMIHYLRCHSIKEIRYLNQQSTHYDKEQPSDEQRIHRDHLLRHTRAALSAYRMEAEFEADEEGLKLVIQAGYDPHQTLHLFEHLKVEMIKENLQEPYLSLTHPILQTRIARFKKILAALPQGAIGKIKNEHKFKTHLRQMILNNVHLDLKVGRFDQARQIAEKFLSQYGENAQMYYLLGEVYRQQRTSPQDLVRAKHYYEMAIRLDSEFPESYRALGLIFYKKGEMQTAKKYFEASLALAPNASENSFIRDYLRRIYSLKTWGRDGDE